MPEILITPEDEPVAQAFLAEMRGITTLNIPSTRTTTDDQNRSTPTEEGEEE